MKTFLVTIKSGDRWEVCPGNYIVNAHSEERAFDLFMEKIIDDFEDIEIKEIKKDEECFIEIQGIVVE